MRIGAWILLLAALGCKGDDAGTPTGDTGAVDTDTDTGPPTDAERVANILTLTRNAAAGKLKYEGSPGCHECHLKNGAGGGPYPALTDRLPLMDDTAVATVIVVGFDVATPGAPDMLPYGPYWTDQEIADTMGYIRSTFDPAR